MFSIKQHIQEQWNENDTKCHKTIWKVRMDKCHYMIFYSWYALESWHQTLLSNYKTLIAEWKKYIFLIKRKSFHFISSLFLTRWSIVLFFSNGIDLLSIPHYCYSKGLTYAGNIHVWNINNILNWISYKIKWQ